MRKASLSLAGLAMLASGGLSAVPGAQFDPFAQAASRAAPQQPASPNSSAASPEQRAIHQAWKDRRSTRRRFPSPGWSVMHDRRLARKRRNRAANRKAHRG